MGGLILVHVKPSSLPPDCLILTGILNLIRQIKRVSRIGGPRGGDHSEQALLARPISDAIKVQLLRFQVCRFFFPTHGESTHVPSYLNLEAHAQISAWWPSPTSVRETRGAQGMLFWCCHAGTEMPLTDVLWALQRISLLALLLFYS